jgi:hypothetical protein
MRLLRALFVWPVLLVELVREILRHGLHWFRSSENRIHLINFLIIGASTFFLFGTIRMFMPNMPESIRLMVTIIIGVLEYMALEHVSQVLRSAEQSGSLSLDLRNVDRRFVAMSLVLAIAATLNIMGSYIDVHYRLAGDEATTEFEEHEAQDVHQAALAEVYPDLQSVQRALGAAERDYLEAAAIARRGLEQQDGEWAQSFYGVGQGAGPRYDALLRISEVASRESEALAQKKQDFVAAVDALQNAYAASEDPVERDVLRQRAYDQIRQRFDGFPVPGPEFSAQLQRALREIHTVPAGQEPRIPALEEDAVLILSSRGLIEGPPIPDRDLSMRQAIGKLSGHIRYAWHDLLRGGTEAWIAAGVALVLDGSVLLLSMAWYALFMLPYLIAVLVRDLLGVSSTAVARAVGTFFGRVVMLPSEVAVVGATEFREAWRKAREESSDPNARKSPPAEAVLDDVLSNAEPARARRVVRVFARARFEPHLEPLEGPGFVVRDDDLDGLGQDDPLVWNALVTDLLLSGADPALLRLEIEGGRILHLFRPEVISAAKRLLDRLDRTHETGISDTMRKALDRYREELSGAEL